MPFCLIPSKVDEFKKALKEKDIKIADLINMTSAERIKLLEKYAEANAKDVNLLFEEKLVLKNKIQGIKNWASKVGEIGRYDPKNKVKIDEMVSEFKARQMERIFNPKEEEAFLESLAEKKLGTNITREEAKNIFELSAKADKLKENYKDGKWTSEKDRLEYGSAKRVYEKYVEELKDPELPIIESLKSYSKDVGDLWQTDKPAAIVKILGDSALQIAQNATAFTATADNSFIGRQGIITLTKNPKIWWNMAKESFSDFAKTLKGQDPTDALWADIYSRPNQIEGWYDDAKLFPKTEEQFPASLPERIPAVGRIFKASEFAFKGSAVRARADLFDMMAKVYEGTGNKMSKPLAEDIGTLVNAITARGKVGQIGASKPVQLLMWAPKMLKADWDILTAHTFGAGLRTGFTRKEAAKTVFNVILATAALDAIAIGMGADVELDPRSSDFLAIRIGNTTIKNPFPRGMTQIVTLISRLITQQTKDSRTKIISDLNTGDFGSKTSFDVGLDFLINKTTPPVRAGVSYLKGRDITGKKPTMLSTLFGMTPISFQNFMDLKDEATIQSVVGAFLDLIGISSNTYTRETDWSQSNTKELTEFKNKVGEYKFKEANDKFNSQYNGWLNDVVKTDKYLSLSDDEKRKEIDKKKKELKQSIFKEYGFTK